MNSESVVEVSGLEVRYDKATILKNINLIIGKGEIVGLLGPSGSGKTTLVKAMIGMKEPVKGEVQVHGLRMPSLSAVLDIGYMAQSDALYDDLNPVENLIFFGELYGLKKNSIRERALNVLKLVRLDNDRSKAVKNFSGGMKRRLSLAIALMHAPSLLILDEPTIGIDPLLRQDFWAEFRRIRNGGGSIILTTHAMDEALKCDRLALIRDGEIIADGRPDELMASSNTSTLEEAFLYYSVSKEAAI
jgi:ABC-2 type transport system ATP-binding protein